MELYIIIFLDVAIVLGIIFTIVRFRLKHKSEWIESELSKIKTSKSTKEIDALAKQNTDFSTDIITDIENSFPNHFITTEEEQSFVGNIDVSKIQIKDDFPPCIKDMLKNPLLGYYERGVLICYLRDDGYSFYEILTILKTTLSKEKYYHCTEEENQPQYLYYDREDMLFASCQTLKNNGLCPSNECHGQWLYL